MFSDFRADSFFEQVLFEVFGEEVNISSFQILGGGCINNAVKLETAKGNFFLKYNFESPENMFEIESKGLELLASSNIIKIPKVIAFQKNYLLLEFIDSSIKIKDYWQDFGENLAQIHQNTNLYFGLDYDNYIGSLPQNNKQSENGIEFLIEKRFRVQASLAMYTHLIDNSFYKKFDLFYQKLPDLIPNEKPALLHGDLWTGNVMVGNDGKVVLIDTAVYYGFREMELAFTQLFGGFDRRFYEAYQAHFPLEQGFDKRVEIYNLYPLLVHLNLFGTSYLGGVKRIIEKYL